MPNEVIEMTDEIDVIERDGNSTTRRSIPIDDFRTRINNDPGSYKEVRVDEEIDLTDLNAKYVVFHAIPAGSLVRYAGILIRETVVAGGNVAKVGMGPQGSDPDQFGKTSDLLAGTQFSNLLPDATSLLSATTVHICGDTTAGALGDTSITAGAVRAVLVYHTPNVLE